MDLPLNCVYATPSRPKKKKKKRSSSNIGRHNRDKKQKVCRLGTTIGAFPSLSMPSLSMLQSTPLVLLSYRNSSDTAKVKAQQNKANYAERKCVQKYVVL